MGHDKELDYLVIQLGQAVGLDAEEPVNIVAQPPFVGSRLSLGSVLRILSG
jgi:hypothetical protein